MLDDTRHSEIRLIHKLREFNKNIYYDYCEKTTSLFEDIGKNVNNLEWIQKPQGTPDLFFYNFDCPIYILLSHPISHFKKTPEIWLTQGESKICLEQALVPVYSFTTNTYSVVRLWSEGAKRFFSPTAAELSEQLEYWCLRPKIGVKKGSKISSLNFIIKQNSQMMNAPKKMREIIEYYFNYLFWSFPEPGYSSNAHFIYNQNNITTFFKTTKSIFSIYFDEYDDKLNIGFNSMDIVRVGLSCLTLQNLKPKWIEFHPILTKDVYDELKEIDTYNFFINGVISEFRRRGGTKINILNIVAKYGYSHIELLMSIIGMISWYFYIENNKLSYVIDKKTLENKITEILKFLSERVSIERTISDTIEDKFGYAFDDLYPNLIISNDKVYISHPLIFSILDSSNILNRIIDDKEAYTNLICLIDVISDKKIKEVKNSDLYKKNLTYIKFEQRLDSILYNIKNKILFMKKLHQYMVINKPIFKDKKDHDKDPLVYNNVKPNVLIKQTIMETNICPSCLGLGFTVTIRYNREDGQIQRISDRKKCLLCNGSGKKNKL